jgi:hypothetical protein
VSQLGGGESYVGQSPILVVSIPPMFFIDTAAIPFMLEIIDTGMPFMNDPITMPPNH